MTANTKSAVVTTAPQTENAVKAEWNRNRNRSLVDLITSEKMDNSSAVLRIPFAPIDGLTMSAWLDVREVIQNVTTDLIASKRIPLRLGVVGQRSDGKWIPLGNIGVDAPQFAPLCIVRHDGTIRAAFVMPVAEPHIDAAGTAVDGTAYIRTASGAMELVAVVRYEAKSDRFTAGEVFTTKRVIREATAPINTTIDNATVNVTADVVNAADKRDKRADRDAKRLHAWMVKHGHIVELPVSE